MSESRISYQRDSERDEIAITLYAKGKKYLFGILDNTQWHGVSETIAIDWHRLKRRHPELWSIDDG